jgi:hypothetical protein
VPLRADTPLTLSAEHPADRDRLATLTLGTYEIRGEVSLLATPTSGLPDGIPILEFEYFCAGGVRNATFAVGPPFTADSRSLPPIAHSEAWIPYSAVLADAHKPLPDNWKQLRLTFPLPADRVLQLRNLRLRSARPDELNATAKTPTATTLADALNAYLNQTFPAAIREIELTHDAIHIAGQVPIMSGELFLAEIPMEYSIEDPARREVLLAIETSNGGDFKVEVPRHRDRDGHRFDRFASRWQLVKRTDSGFAALTSERYADVIACRAPELPVVRLNSKKGLGGWSADRTPFAAEELDDLGISAVTVNVMIHSMVALEPEPNTTPFEWQGRTYHARNAALAAHDRTFLEASKRGAMVSAILLVANPARGGNAVVNLLGHPDAVKDGMFAMPNMNSREGFALYGAILNLMAERWSRPDNRYGRVHHWIMHNEVDAGWVWTNAGEKPAIIYMDLYHRSMRLMDLIARQYDPSARPFISLTHHWAEPGEARWYGSKTMLEQLVRFERAEGTFPWALAYHPYPQNLFNPRAWEDDQARFDFDTPKITPRNLEVLEHYMRQPAMLHHGTVRPIHLSENGFNSKDYSEKELADQAAGMAMAWKKIQQMPAVESWQYHNWIDNRHEGGLKIGLRKFPDDLDDPHGKKPIWHLFKALGTPDEDRLCNPYLNTIGISAWTDIIHRETIAN